MRRPGHLRTSTRDGWSQVVAVACLGAFVVGVYVVVVVGGGALTGRTSTPSRTLSVVATVVVALGFERARRWSELAAAGLLHRSAASPYDVLSRFSGTVTGGYATGELPDR